MKSVIIIEMQKRRLTHGTGYLIFQKKALEQHVIYGVNLGLDLIPDRLQNLPQHLKWIKVVLMGMN
jgi:hypothetical protein